MKKLIKIITAIAFFALLFGCEITFVALENNVTITHRGDLQIDFMYLVPASEYTVVANRYNYSDAFAYYSARYDNLLIGEDVFTTGESKVIDLNDHYGSTFKLVSFEPVYLYNYESAYVTTVTDYMNYVNIEATDYQD